jgi:hypothetical protein
MARKPVKKRKKKAPRKKPSIKRMKEPATGQETNFLTTPYGSAFSVLFGYLLSTFFWFFELIVISELGLANRISYHLFVGYVIAIFLAMTMALVIVLKLTRSRRLALLTSFTLLPIMIFVAVLLLNLTA